MFQMLVEELRDKAKGAYGDLYDRTGIGTPRKERAEKRSSDPSGCGYLK